MILPDFKIKQFILDGIIQINPLPDFENQLGPCSLDLKLGNSIKVFKKNLNTFLDLKNIKNFENLMDEILIKDGDSFILEPKSFALAITKENFSLPDDIMARLEGRSSLARLGIIVHLTASRFDPGFSGQAVLELYNLGSIPVILYEGMRICSLIFEKLDSKSEFPYGSKQKHKYINQNNPLASKIHKDL